MESQMVGASRNRLEYSQPITSQCDGFEVDHTAVRSIRMCPHCC